MIAWLQSAASWLTPRRLTTQAVLLALCTWTVCAVDFSSPGFFDRAGNLKFQDFLPLYVSARLIAAGHSRDLYDQPVIAAEIRTAIRQQASSIPASAARVPHFWPPLPEVGISAPNVVLPNLYGPQVGLVFTPLARFSFPTAARIWVTFSLLLYGTGIWTIWHSCPPLRPHWRLVMFAAAAFPPLFHFFVRGQISVLVLASFSAAFFAFRSDRPGFYGSCLAGFALGLLAFKPQFLVAIPFVFLLARAWPSLAGLVFSATAQLGFAWIYFGSSVIRSYFYTLWHIPRWIGAAELSLAPIQMHSLRSFWTLLVPWPQFALALYLLSSIFAIALAASIWRSTSPLALRFSALILAAVLVNPHLFVYDLLALAPALLLVADWTLQNPHSASTNSLQLLTYLAFILPLFGPLSRWTHFQLSVPAFAALLWTIQCCPAESAPS